MLSLERKIVLVTRPTQFQGLVSQHHTEAMAEFKMVRARVAAPRAKRSAKLAEQVEEDKAIAMAAVGAIDALREVDESYTSDVARLRTELSDLAPVHVLDRQYLPRYVFGPEDVVLTLGQDGLVANTAKYALHHPIVAVNPDPKRIDGVLLPFTVDEAHRAVRAALRGEAKTKRVTLAEAVLLDGQRLLAFNDLFIGARTHVSARYRVEFGGRDEQQSSSGMIVSTGAGSTGWLSSILNLRSTLAKFGSQESNAPTGRTLRLPWDDPRLVFVTREPFRSKMSGIDLTSGFIQPGLELVVESNMSTEGVIFSDGIEADFIEFNAGAIARIRVAQDHAVLVTKG